ncbi:hypothetical protein FGU71_00720 [Erythrobacter insulae]|uniref:TolC family protein n=1 Tax=Erythrobacter insulae TaxID=2584124 RepID=A0A547P8P9_9SPHN|nr:hypothetical protein FGU71_00720 [Erythrobacter insulae]
MERVAGQFRPAPPQSAEAIRPVASEKEISEIVGRADEAHRRFLARRADARRLVESARLTNIESNVRQRALIALADLASLRSDTVLSLGDLDLLRAEAETTFAPTDDIFQAQARIGLSLNVQNGIINSLWADLGQ